MKYFIFANILAKDLIILEYFTHFLDLKTYA